MTMGAKLNTNTKIKIHGKQNHVVVHTFKTTRTNGDRYDPVLAPLPLGPRPLRSRAPKDACACLLCPLWWCPMQFANKQISVTCTMITLFFCGTRVSYHGSDFDFTYVSQTHVDDSVSVVGK